jgi:hypothetical protein
MSTAQIIGFVGLTMLIGPAFVIFVYFMIGGMVDSYKHAKWKDGIEGTSWRVKQETHTILLVLWLLAGGICMFVACFLS